ncbi:hypothetical protein [Nodularia sphaerocarpa]|uniref:hypothetical protein n=1 Tax=Nodularia sphaerocarpa TaxID=137816 RepID=UPI001EFBA0BB|nr:hypothetical protein [Nodularia sphaerocarpa]MDB9372795.1 hypothetical protein [Nodularia sphaerocarpa CS-585]MDB9376744.1 hypothetical protein [Nodularia sphaerocarpa CS-585A2]ULP74159.1 hypothetical protein BDGGKGIB_03822 [Nodularia sphaerocarpa UHCC 0038]
MSSHCDAGDTAKVTLPNGVIETFTDTPITIECEQDNSTSRRYFVTVKNTVVYPPSPQLPNGATQVFNFSGSRWSVDGDLFSTRVVNIQNSVAPQIYTRGGGLTPANPRWENMLSSSSQNDIIIEIISITPIAGLPPAPKTITITGASGNVLLSANFDDCNYQVECITGCPPNTLDCGDCCLDCDSVLSAIQGMRSQISNL